MANKEQLVEYAFNLRQRVDDMLETYATKFNNNDFNYFRKFKNQITNFILALDKTDDSLKSINDRLTKIENILFESDNEVPVGDVVEMETELDKTKDSLNVENILGMVRGF